MSNSLSKQCVGLNPESSIHYMDHLGPICVLMNIPLLFLAEDDRQLGKAFYPELKTDCADFDSFGPEYLVSHYDVLFMSDLWNRETMREKFHPYEERYHKRMRTVYVPHGYSDKRYYLREVAMEDIALVYGQSMLDMFRGEGVFEKLHRYVVTGNVRYSYYLRHRQFYNDLAEREIFSRFAVKQRTLLYAPTWMDVENSSSYFSCFEDVIGRLPESWNLIVKLHPRLELDDAVLFYQILGQYEGKPNVVFADKFPPVYPILAHCDAYIGDVSSVGYDYLAFDRPMFFLNTLERESARLPLFHCGREIRNADLPLLYEIIDREIGSVAAAYAERRQVLYSYTFGEERSPEDIRREIVDAFHAPAPK